MLRKKHRNPLSQCPGFVLHSLTATEIIWLTDEMLHIKLYEDGNGGTEEVDTALAAAFVLLQGMWPGNNSEKPTRSAELKNLHRLFQILNLLLPGMPFAPSVFYWQCTFHIASSTET